MIQGHLTEADYVTAQWLHIKPRPLVAVLVLLPLLAALTVMVLDRQWSLIATFIFLVVVYFAYLPFRSRRLFRQHKALAERISVEPRDEGLFFQRENANALVPWSYLMKWRSSDKLLLLYPTKGSFYMLPASLFTNQAAFEDFRRLIEAKLGKAR